MVLMTTNYWFQVDQKFHYFQSLYFLQLKYSEAGKRFFFAVLSVVLAQLISKFKIKHLWFLISTDQNGGLERTKNSYEKPQYVPYHQQKTDHQLRVIIGFLDLTSTLVWWLALKIALLCLPEYSFVIWSVWIASWLLTCQ